MDRLSCAGPGAGLEQRRNSASHAALLATPNRPRQRAGSVDRCGGCHALLRTIRVVSTRGRGSGSEADPSAQAAAGAARAAGRRNKVGKPGALSTPSSRVRSRTRLRLQQRFGDHRQRNQGRHQRESLLHLGSSQTICDQPPPRHPGHRTRTKWQRDGPVKISGHRTGNHTA